MTINGGLGERPNACLPAYLVVYISQPGGLYLALDQGVDMSAIGMNLSLSSRWRAAWDQSLAGLGE